ncbi:MAG: acetolactate synthase small subunit, partial [Alphaproteobacteria bacterium]|nr:acetolactate synthase small subunit [Alphaproteobacteria bacterium]
IESLTVTEIDNRRHLSRISLVTRGTSMTIEQIKSQLLRIVPVHLVRDLTLEGPFIKSELALIKLVADGANRVEALRIAETFRARTLDVTLGSFVFELTGRPNKIDAFIGLMKSLGDTEISRTGVSAISRGDKTETKVLEQIKLT